jgi:hypothetical protein
MADSALLARRAPGVNTLSGLGPRRGTPRQGGRRCARSGWHVFSRRAALSVRGKDRLGYSRPNSRLARHENSCHHGSNGFSDRLLGQIFLAFSWKGAKKYALWVASLCATQNDFRIPRSLCRLSVTISVICLPVTLCHRRQKLERSRGLFLNLGGLCALARNIRVPASLNFATGAGLRCASAGSPAIP